MHREGCLTIVVDDHGLSIMVDIAVMIALLDDNGIVTIMVVALLDDFTIAIAVAIPVMASSDGYADRTDADTDFFRAGRHGETNSGRSHGNYCKTLDHHVLLSL
jgi:hypothetical protein